jgi:hypothetical protein
MDNPHTKLLPSPSPAAAPPPAGQQTRSSKGKGHEQRPPDAPVPHGSRGTKHSITGEGTAGPMASASNEEPLDNEGNITPRKSGAPVPCVQVDDVSPPAPLNVQRSWPQVMYAYIYIHIHCFLLICHSGLVWPLQEGFSGDVQAPGQQPSDHSMPALCSLEEDLHSSCFMGPAHHRSDECEHGQYVIHFASFFFLSQISVAASAETPATSQSLYSRVDTLEQKVDMVLRLLNSLCSHQGIDMSTIPGYSNLPPLHCSVSPSVTAQSASLLRSRLT